MALAEGTRLRRSYPFQGIAAIMETIMSAYIHAGSFGNANVARAQTVITTNSVRSEYVQRRRRAVMPNGPRQITESRRDLPQ
jgi:hypothetical protein